jgi:trimeric autotransporter adhesin
LSIVDDTFFPHEAGIESLNSDVEIPDQAEIILDSSGNAYGSSGDDTIIVDASILTDGIDNDISLGEGTDTFVADFSGFEKGEDDLSSEGIDFHRAYGTRYIDRAGTTLAHISGAEIYDIIGTRYDDTIYGDSGNDTLIGGAGDDSLIGGVGDDLYGVDSIGDVVVENADEGIDTVQSSISYSLLENFENLTLIGGGNIKGIGNAARNLIIGNGGNNTLNGGDGDDTLIGGAGNDLLVGGAGADRMEGGLGDDVFLVGNAGDTVVEAADEGIDTVQSSISYSLLENVENLTLTGNGALSGTGNALANTITGNAGNNILDGGAGNDTLNGGAGADSMYGGLGDDTFIVDNVGDMVVEAEGAGIDIVMSSVSYALDGNIENLTLTGNDDIVGTGNALDNVIIGNTGKNTLYGGDGNDLLIASPDVFTSGNTLYGGAGNDTLMSGRNSVDTLVGGSGDDLYILGRESEVIVEYDGGGIDTVRTGGYYILRGRSQFIENIELIGTGIYATGNSLNNVITGNASNNVLNGAWGNDTLFGGDGNDTFIDDYGVDYMEGGNGNDTYYLDDRSDRVVEWKGQGKHDIIVTAMSLALGDYSAFVENLTLTGSRNINGTGNGLDNVIRGNAGNNVLDGALGADTMIGCEGDDIYIVDNTGDRITERLNRGTDTVMASISFALRDISQNLDNLILTGSSDLDGIGNALDNVLTGNSGANRLNGALGADTMIGGYGDDTYVIDSTGDRVTERPNQGHDRIESSISLALRDISQNVEELTLTGTGNINGTGNALDNVITGNAGNNILDGALGADTMIGGEGDDTYIVDSTGDRITELLNQGTDTVLASFSFALRDRSQNLENLTLTGSSDLDGIGNALDNVLTGNSGANRLNGALGDDTMIGGYGDDTFVVNSTGDRVTEYLNQGHDRIESSISLALRDISQNVEELKLTGTANLNGTGNALDNLIAGNAGNNVLDGALGADTMIGGEGDDTYILDDLGDVVTEYTGQGTDTVKGGISLDLRLISQKVENIVLTGTGNIDGYGNGLNNVITGNDGNNVLNGAWGNDTLDGGAGNDTLSDDNGNDVFFGGAGADLFIFVDGFGNDVIKDFNTSEVGEYIDLSHVSEIAGFDDLMANHLSSNEYGNAVIDDGHGNSIILQGVAMNSLQIDDFLFPA